eukprot:106607_1
MFGYEDATYGEKECLVWGKEFWPEASPNFPTITYNALIYIPIFCIWRLIFEKCIDNSAEKYAHGQMLKKGNTTSFDTNKKKYKESYWKTITNSILMFYGFWTMWYHAPFFWDPQLLFESWPQAMTFKELIYYRLAIGYHGHRAIWGLFWDKKRVDFLAYVLHHWVTELLIVGSWSVGLAKHGVIVMCLHDSADVFLSASKTCSYNNNRIGVILSFSCFTVSWIGCRLIMYPLKVIYPALVCKSKYDCHPLYWVFISLLSILLILHIYWGKHICGYLYYMITKPSSSDVMHDPRSDTEDNSQKVNSSHVQNGHNHYTKKK